MHESKRCRIAMGVVLVAAGAALVAAAEVPRRTVNDGTVVLEGVPELPAELAATLAPYQNTRQAGFAAFDFRTAGIYILTRFAETNQVHFVAAPGAARRQVTFYGEPVTAVLARPESTELALTMDVGGAEFYQLYLFDTATGQRRLLTDGRSRNLYPLWSDNGGLLAYQSTRRDGRANDIWLMQADRPESAQLVLAAPDGSSWIPRDFSSDRRRLLVEQYVSASDSRIHLLDIATGRLTGILGDPEHPSTNRPLAFDKGDRGIFYITDADGEFRQLARLDLISGETQPLTAMPWDVGEFAISPSGSRAAFTINRDGRDVLYLLDPASGLFRDLEGLPQGLISGLELSYDAHRLAFGLSTPSTPNDVFLVEIGPEPLAGGDPVRWTQSEVGGLDPTTFVEPELIHYPTFDEAAGQRRTIPAFVYRPRTPGPHPVIVSIHGGPEGQSRPGFSSTLQMWVGRLGAAVITPNVRGSAGYGKSYLALDNGARREDSVRDIGALLDWIATQPDLDARRVVVYGGSYGGYMVLASLVHYSDRLAAGIELVGISNFVTFLEHTQDYRRDLRREEYGDERDPRMRALLESFSPASQARRITAPLLVGQGANDPRVPASESAQVVAAVRAAGYDVWYMIAGDEGHGFRKKANRDLWEQIVLHFLEEHLRQVGP